MWDPDSPYPSSAPHVGVQGQTPPSGRGGCGYRFNFGNCEEKLPPGRAGECWDPGAWTTAQSQQTSHTSLRTLSSVGIWVQVIFVMDCPVP